MNSSLALSAMNIALVLLIGTAITSFSNNTFPQTSQAGKYELTHNEIFSESSSDLDSPLGPEPPELNIPDVNETYRNSDVGLDNKD
jgi:hypothetical protein